MSARPSGGPRQTLPDSRPPQKRGREPKSPESPISPPRSAGPLTRKRAASLRTDPRIEDLNLNTLTPESGSYHHPVEKVRERELICLCTPAPKVPRPRNAFILYRQHHQANVTAQHPGLSNPEISKIIGERWRDESDENKEQWKRLAEEEKQRHQRQYPDYRYQPRRGGKNSTAGGAASRAQTPTEAGGDPGRCPKCGGRYIATPRTPGPGGSSTSSAPYSFAAAPAASSRPGTMSSTASAYANHTSARMGGEMDHRGGPGRGSFVAYGQPGPPHHAQHQHQQQHQHQHQHHQLQGISEDYELASPSEKRRRYDSYDEMGAQHDPRQSSASYRAPFPYPHPYPHHMRQQQAPPPLQQQQQPHHVRRSSLTSSGMPSPAYPPPNTGPLPGPSLLGRSSVNMAPPPPRPGSVGYSQPSGPRRETGNLGGFDESLRLPPLQSTSSGPQAPSQNQPASSPHQQQALPPPLRANVLQIVSPTSEDASTSTIGPAISPQRERDRALGVEAMVMSIPYINKLKVLEKISPPLPPQPEASAQSETRGPVIAIEGPNPSLVRQVGAIVERALAASGECAVRSWGSGSADHQGDDGQGSGSLKFGAYLETILEWHGRSEEIVKHITSLPNSGDKQNSNSHPDTDPNTKRRRGSDESMAEADVGHPKGKTSVSDHEDAASSSSSSASETKSNVTGTTTTVPSAYRRMSQQQPLMPVALLRDGFSLTLSDRFACRVPIADSYAPVDHWQWMATLWRGIVGPDLVVYVRAAEEEEVRDGRVQGVELKGAGTMIVSVVAPPSQRLGEPAVGEKIERRLGFEVVEWVRSGTFREAL